MKGNNLIYKTAISDLQHFEKFRKIVNKMKLGEHLTDQGLNDIRKIVQEMRKYFRSDETKQRLCVDRPVQSFEDKVQPLS